VHRSLHTLPVVAFGHSNILYSEIRSDVVDVSYTLLLMDGYSSAINQSVTT